MTERVTRCSVCSHADREAIDAELVGGGANTVTGERYGLSKDAVRRHRLDHLPGALVAVQADRAKAGTVTAVARVEGLYERASTVLDAVESDGKAALTLAALRELRGIVELLARLTGELDERPQVQVLNVAASPEWGTLRDVLLRALDPYPEAAQAVAGALARAGRDV